MILRRVHPDSEHALDFAEEHARLSLLDWYRPPRRGWLRLNLVTTVNGSAAGTDGTSNTITSAMDRRILSVIRELSDVVLVGASSVRSEGYQIPKLARLAVVTSTGDLGGHRIDPDASDRLIVVCPPAALSTVRAQFPHALAVHPASTESNRMSVFGIVAALRHSGLESIVCEGGPNLASQLVNEGLVDELCLTTSPLVTSARLSLLAMSHPPGASAEHPLVLKQLLIDDASSLYARWSFNRSAEAVERATI